MMQMRTAKRYEAGDKKSRNSKMALNFNPNISGELASTVIRGDQAHW
jgi:hypothetical protein